MLLLTSKRGYALILFFCWIKPFHYASGQFFNADPKMEQPKPFCDIRISSRDTGNKAIFSTPTSCFETLDPTAPDNIEIGALYAEGMAKIQHEMYPEEVHVVSEAFMPYDEPLHPIPVGASVFYIIMIAMIVTFYFTYLGRKVLVKFKEKLDLHPESDRFPNLPLCWLQQGKREAELRREVRNTWAWLARRYLLSPNDPLLANVDQVLGLVNWHDFEVSRDTWSLVKVILTMNAMYVKVRKHKQEGRKSFEIIKDINLAKRKSMENDPIQITRVFEDRNADKEGHYVGGAKLPEGYEHQKVYEDTGMIQMEQPKKDSVDSREGRGGGREVKPAMPAVAPRQDRKPVPVKVTKSRRNVVPPSKPEKQEPVERRKEPSLKSVHKRRRVVKPPPPPPPSKPFHWMRSNQTFSWMQNETPAASEEPSKRPSMDTTMDTEATSAINLEPSSILVDDESIATTLPTTDTETSDADYSTDNRATSTDMSVASSVRRKRRRRRKKKRVRIDESKRWEYFYKP